MNHLEQVEVGRATDGKSSKGSIENQLNSDLAKSDKSSTGRKDDLLGGVDDNIFDDFGNLDIIMENYKDDYSKTNHMFATNLTNIETDVDFSVDLGDNLDAETKKFEEEFFDSWKRKGKKVGGLIWG